ncbi:MAG: DUF4416 family protein [Synergistaceae bacterium]|nr:DUF4416 family protein [Synergistaceae bacterium]
MTSGKNLKGLPKPVKIISGILYPKDVPELLEWTAGRLSERFGDIERESGPYDFDYTDYYRDISPNLARCFLSFRGVWNPGEIAVWKKFAVRVEACSADDAEGGRRVNVDPGYVDGARLVLASTKDSAHRIYLGRGIYAELTLRRRKSRWESFSYTFPDFKSGVYCDFLDAVRLDWKRDIQKQTSAGSSI